MNGNSFFDYISVGIVVWVIYVLVKMANNKNEEKQEITYRKNMQLQEELHDVNEAVSYIEQAYEILSQETPSYFGSLSDSIYFSATAYGDHEMKTSYMIALTSFREYSSENKNSWANDTSFRNHFPHWHYSSIEDRKDFSGVSVNGLSQLIYENDIGGSLYRSKFIYEVLNKLKEKHPTWKISQLDEYINITCN